MKNKLFFTAVFLLGCATPNIIEYVSFDKAIAKTGSKCHYVAEESYHSEVGYVKDGKSTSATIKILVL